MLVPAGGRESGILTATALPAAEALRELGDPRVVEPLIAALQDNYGYVGNIAAVAPGAFDGQRAIEPLIAALQNGATELRRNAASALGEIGDQRAIERNLIS